MAMVIGWELDDPFNAESVELLLQNYIGAAVATYRTYLSALVEASRETETGRCTPLHQAPTEAEAAAWGFTVAGGQRPAR